MGLCGRTPSVFLTFAGYWLVLAMLLGGCPDDSSSESPEDLPADVPEVASGDLPTDHGRDPGPVEPQDPGPTVDREVVSEDEGVGSAEVVEGEGVTDDDGGGVVEEPPPTMTVFSAPPEVAVAEEPWSYRVVPTAVGKPTFTKTEGPAGMELEPDTGQLSWTPTNEDEGRQCAAVEITVAEESVEHSFCVTVVRTEPLAEATVGNEGGTVAVSDGTGTWEGAGLVVPGGALDKEVDIEVNAVVGGIKAPGLPTGESVGAVALGPSGQTFAKPVEIHLPVDKEALASFLSGVEGAPEEAFTVMAYQEETGAFEPVPVAAVDPESGVVVAEVSHFTIYYWAPWHKRIKITVADTVAVDACERSLLVGTANPMGLDEVASTVLTGLPADAMDRVDAGDASDVKSLVLGDGFSGSLRSRFDYYARVYNSPVAAPSGSDQRIVTLYAVGDGSGSISVTTGTGAPLLTKEIADLDASWDVEVEPLLLGESVAGRVRIDGAVVDDDTYLYTKAYWRLRYQGGDASTQPTGPSSAWESVANDYDYSQPGTLAEPVAQSPDKDCDGVHDALESAVVSVLAVEAEPEGTVPAVVGLPRDLSCEARTEEGETIYASVWSVDPEAGGTVTAGEDGSATFVPAAPGLVTVTCVFSSDLPGEHSFAVQVAEARPANLPPSCEVSASAQVTSINESVSLTALVDDAETPDTLEVEWGVVVVEGDQEVLGTQSSVVLSHGGGTDAQLSLTSSGTFWIGCRAFDGELWGSVGSVAVEAVRSYYELRQPSLMPLSAKTPAGEAVTLKASVNHYPNNYGAMPTDAVSFTWEPAGNVAAGERSVKTYYSSARVTQSATFVSDTPGVYTVTVTLEDGANAPKQQTAEVVVLAAPTVVDVDMDGYDPNAAELADCDDNDKTVHPAAEEECGNEVDDNCNGETDEGFPTGPDGKPDCGVRIEDEDNDFIPDATDNCPAVPNPAQVDTDADTQGDACDTDDDGDGSLDWSDCAPTDVEVHPGADETCNAVDDDCNGETDEGFDASILCDDGVACTIDTCGAAGCAHVPLDCSDASPCTVDTCEEGVCVHTLSDDAGCCDTDRNCADGDPCTTNTCDPQSKTCSSEDAPGASCEDGDACTTGDTCASGSCHAGASTPCDDGLGCTSDLCSPADSFAPVEAESIDIAGTGEAILLSGSNVAAGAFEIGFPFPFFDGSVKTSFGVSSSGLITFDDQNAYSSNYCEPKTWKPNAYIAPYWDSLSCHASLGCSVARQNLGQAPDRRLVVQWTKASVCCPSSTLTFQVVIFEDGRVEMSYWDLEGTASHGRGATIGMESSDGRSAVFYSCNRAVVSEGLVLRYPAGHGCKSDLLPGNCLIDGVCYAPGDTDEDQGCERYCDPELDPRAWSIMGSDAPNHDGDERPDACDDDDDNDGVPDEADCEPFNVDVFPGAGEKCNGADDNCNSETDEGFPLGEACSVGSGPCAGDGVYRCASDAQGVVCDAIPYAPVRELCDGEDNNCDGQTDELYAVGLPCAVGFGLCQRAAVWQCAEDGSVECPVEPGPAGVEVCGNEEDENCDGIVDNGCGEEPDPEDGPVLGANACYDPEIRAPYTSRDEIVHVRIRNFIAVDDDGTPTLTEEELAEHLARLNTVYEDAAGIRFMSDGLPVRLPPDHDLYWFDPFSSVDRAKIYGYESDDAISIFWVFMLEGRTGLAGTRFVYIQAGKPPSMPVPANISVLAHEMGHTLGLMHTHACYVRDPDRPPEGPESTEPLCWQVGDRICDTPPDPGFALVTGADRACWRDDVGVDGHCEHDPETCLATCPGGYAPDARNVMSYYNCKDEAAGLTGRLSTEQGDLLRCAAQLTRPALLVQPEQCNGLDDDGDGLIDEDFWEKGLPCDNGLLGECFRRGRRQCSEDGTSIVCDAEVVSGSAEVCDGKDNDCNGDMDEGEGVCPCEVGETRTCYTGPAVTLDVGICRAGEQTCIIGGYGPCEGQVLPRAEACDARDNDCNGLPDDGLGTTTCGGTGECLRTVDNCVDGQPQDCVPGEPQPESCDGRDNNCNNATDEGFGTETCGVGACERTVDRCRAGLPQECTQGTPEAEVCDGIDNDCNSFTDDGEDLCPAGAACREGVCDCVSSDTCESLGADCGIVVDSCGDPLGCGPCPVPIAAGQYHSCVLTSAGGAKCWGWGTALGHGTHTSSSTPVDVVDPPPGLTAISAGEMHTCALTAGGQVWCWGSGGDGAVGDGSTSSRRQPVEVTGVGAPAVTLSCGLRHSCAVLETGQIECWGANTYGELGDGSSTQRISPVAASGLAEHAAEVAAGAWHTCALTVGGAVRCWGRNRNGQLGDGTTTDSLAPVGVPALDGGVVAIAAGDEHTCVLTTEGAVKCWGAGGGGRLGNGATARQLAPVEVEGLSSGVAAVSAGKQHTCAIVGDGGGLKCWGPGTLNGRGYSAGTLVPIDVLNLTSGVAAIGAGGEHSCALTRTGCVRCWGFNSFGGLGDGTTQQSPKPVHAVCLDCTPSLEVCDGVDNDCNGATDGEGGVELDCDENAACTPGDEGAACVCDDGYYGDGKTCDLCSECGGPQYEESACTRTSDTVCVPCAPGCMSCSGPSQQDCDDCPPGHVFEPGLGMCVDVDECAAGTDNCALNAVCSNTIGSFDCFCNAGYSGDGVTCTDIDECALGTDDCAVTATCTNTAGSFT